MLLLKLPHNWNGEVRLVGFRSAEGAEVAPVAFAYRTRREPLARIATGEGRTRLRRTTPDSSSFSSGCRPLAAIGPAFVRRC